MLLLNSMLGLTVLLMVLSMIGVPTWKGEFVTKPRSMKRSVRLERQLAHGYAVVVSLGLLFITIHKAFF